jgi:uncharacterized membrane protein
MNTREISLAALIASLYAALVVVLAPVSFGPIQLRVADCIIPLSAVLGWPAVVGVSLGAFLGNAYFFLGPADVILGSVANLLAAVIIFRLRNRLLPACVAGSFAVGLIVGGYLWIYFPPPDIGVAVPAWTAMIVSITLSSLVAIAVIGYMLVSTLLAAGLSKTLRSIGLETHL